MNIEKSTVEKLYITDVDALDPLTVFIENFETNQAKVTMECWGKSWSAYWGGMGGTVAEFFDRTNVGYLVNCFDRGINSTTDRIDKDSYYEEFIPKLKKRVLEYRRETYLDAEDAREWYDYDWHDNWWGDCRCDKCANKSGRNNLGHLLMGLRTHIRERFNEGPHDSEVR